jgi:hypothetical protein
VRGLDVRRFAASAQPEFEFADPELLRDPDGREWRARTDGVLELRRAANSSPNLLTLTDSPLFAPVWSSAAQYAVLSSRSGLLFALDPVRAHASR